MKVVNIPPKNYLDLYALSDYQFALAHMLTPGSAYERWFKNNNDKPIILDNGAAELGKTIHVNDVVKRMRAIRKPGTFFEVWMPDVLYDKDKTIIFTRQFISQLTDEEKENISLVAIPQGQNLDEWLDCYKQMVEWEEVDVIAFSKYSVPKAFEEISGTDCISKNRMLALEYLEKENLFSKPIHLAGGDEFFLDEINYAKKFAHVRSIDSNIGFKLALHGLTLGVADFEPAERLDHEIMCIDGSTLMLAIKNMKRAREAAK